MTKREAEKRVGGSRVEWVSRAGRSNSLLSQIIRGRKNMSPDVRRDLATAAIPPLPEDEVLAVLVAITKPYRKAVQQ